MEPVKSFESLNSIPDRPGKESEGAGLEFPEGEELTVYAHKEIRKKAIFHRWFRQIK